MYNLDMPRKVPFQNDEYYHVFNRGVDKRNVFLDEEDYSYFTHVLDVFNDHSSVINTRYNYRNRISIEKRNPLVEVVSYCLMPNHFHFLIKQISEGGISKFLQKIGIGYTHYFNKKYERSGVLFQGKTKSRHVDTDKYLNYLKMYIDLNALDLFEKDWKKNGLKDKSGAKKFLEEYAWKSKPKNKESDLEFYVTDQEFLEYIDSIEIGYQ